MLRQTSTVSSLHQNKFISVRFLGTAPMFGRPHSRFLSVRMVKSPSVFSSNWKWRVFYNAYFIPVRQFATTPGTMQRCPCVHRFRWRTFWAFFLCVWILTWCTVRTQRLLNWKRVMRTCCQLWVKYCIVQEFIVESHLAIKLKDRLFPDCLCEMFALFCVKNSLLKFVQVFCIHPVYCYKSSSFFASRKFVDVKLFLYLILGDFLGVFFQDAQIPGVRSLGGINFERWRQCLWVLSVDLASCHPSGGRKFEVASTFLKKLCPHVLRNKNKFMCLKRYLNIETTE